MFDAQSRLSPKAIIGADDPSLGPTKRAQRLWANPKVRKETIVSLANSVRLVASLWQSARKVGNGDAMAAGELGRFEESDLSAIYRKESDFIPSMSLDEFATSGNFEPPA